MDGNSRGSRTPLSLHVKESQGRQARTGRVDKMKEETTRRYFIYCDTSRVGKVVCGGVLKAACDSAILFHRSTVTATANANSRCRAMVNKKFSLSRRTSSHSCLNFRPIVALFSCPKIPISARFSPATMNRRKLLPSFHHLAMCAMCSLSSGTEMPFCKHGILVSPRFARLRVSLFVMADAERHDMQRPASLLCESRVNHPTFDVLYR